LEEENLKLDLLDRLEPEDLCELRKYFFWDETQVKKELVNCTTSRRKKNARAKDEQGHAFGGQPLTKRQFVKAVEKVVGK
jgi:hypothetical protein